MDFYTVFGEDHQIRYEDNKLTQSLGFEDIAIDLQDYADSFEIENLYKFVDTNAK